MKLKMSSQSDSYEEFMKRWEETLAPILIDFCYSCGCEKSLGLDFDIKVEGKGSVKLSWIITHFNNIPIEDFDNDDGNVDT